MRDTASIIGRLKKLSSELLETNTPDQIISLFFEEIINTIKTSQIIFVSYNESTEAVQIKQTYGIDNQVIKPPQIVWTSDIEKWLYDGAEILAAQEDKPSTFLVFKENEENQLPDCEIRIPLFTKKRLFGIISLGPKEYGVEYSTDDINLLQILTNLTILAMENIQIKSAQLSTKFNDAVKKPLVQQAPQVKIRKLKTTGEMLGNSQAMQTINEIIEKVASKDVTVLIIGESGTGKELVAQRLHAHSRRSHKPLVTMNCAALPNHLVESELFGHEKGAFTHAYNLKKGRFEVANGSSLFLDEIGEMSLETQAKLLRVLQDGSFQRIGSTRTLHSDVRIIAATNKNLEEEIKANSFRQDLFYRLNVVQICLPPLRERREDILLLASYFAEQYSLFYKKKFARISQKAQEKLLKHNFPGNIRELQNIIERAVIMERSETLTLEFLSSPSGSEAPIQNESIQNQKRTLEELEKQHIEAILHKVNFNKSHAAKILGIARKTLREKIQKYQISAN